VTRYLSNLAVLCEIIHFTVYVLSGELSNSLLSRCSGCLFSSSGVSTLLRVVIFSTVYNTPRINRPLKPPFPSTEEHFSVSGSPSSSPASFEQPPFFQAWIGGEISTCVM